MAQTGVAYDLELFSSRRPHLVEMKNNKKAEEINSSAFFHCKIFKLMV